MSQGGGEDDEEKQFEASAKKLEDARKKGEVPRSNDLITASGYAGFLLASLAVGAASLSDMGQVLAAIIGRADTMSALIFNGSGAPVSAAAGRDLIRDLAPWALAPGILALLSVFAQQAFTVTGTKLQPKLNRISPLANAKNKFGRNGLFEFAKSFFKLVIYCTILFWFLYIQMPGILGTVAMGPAMVTAMMLDLALKFFMLVLVIAFVLGAVDFLWQRAEHLRKNRMSHKDMTDEQKESEGDPHMKQQRRQRGYDIATNQMLNDVKSADVIVVNPTHYAVALKWDRRTGRAPIVVAKGVDVIAMRIREKAQEHGVPLHSDPPTARLLYGVMEIGDEIRPDHYGVVAAAIRFAEEMRKKARTR
ncbi:EscU/YscU/HrcU family type III secretion system export apparatus switch protein [Oceaniglobus ichthyenteri]|uniref:EscU/YscU/HrcU family type III secretion system export apparatus switch protein n=1 Tax=Oceaniglobus ichthyenteri TaxID=2136177 RepID=UPI000D3A8876|nr:flagellar type III secretion system protein FlhB [Oceaniglobus ichthyenteri]